MRTVQGTQSGNPVVVTVTDPNNLELQNIESIIVVQKSDLNGQVRKHNFIKSPNAKIYADASNLASLNRIAGIR